MGPHVYVCTLTQGCLDTVPERAQKMSKRTRRLLALRGAFFSFQEPDGFTGVMSLFKYSAEEEEEVQGGRGRGSSRGAGGGGMIQSAPFC